MDYFYCQLVFILMLSIAMIGLGIVDLFKRDLAWWITERMLAHVEPQRTSDWECSVTINGVILLVFGLLWLVFPLFVILS